MLGGSGTKRYASSCPAISTHVESKYSLDIKQYIHIIVAMYIETIPNRGSRPAVLLREAWREGQRVRKRTVANLTDWPTDQVETLRRVLKGETLVPADKAFVIERSLPHGHVEAVLLAMRRLGLAALLSSRRCRERDGRA